MEHFFEFIIPANHPSLEGHFPGRPIVPAVVILDQVLSFIEKVNPCSSTWTIKSTKFLSILEPNTPLLVEINIGQETLRFTCRSSAAIIAKGVLTRPLGENGS